MGARFLLAVALLVPTHAGAEQSRPAREDALLPRLDKAPPPAPEGVGATGAPCQLKDRVLQPGERARIGCNLCLCREGLAHCSQFLCDASGEKELVPPPPPSAAAGQPPENPPAEQPTAAPPPEQHAADGACQMGGKSYKDGENFSAEDGCNTCRCMNGGALCTMKHCSRPGAEGGACAWRGRALKDGESVPAEDGCNTCHCRGGLFLCTLLACANPEGRCRVGDASFKAGETIRIDNGCNTCHCAGGAALCSMVWCSTMEAKPRPL